MNNPSDTARITASLNLNAVMRNLEDLPLYDPVTEEMIKEWNVSIRFLVRHGPSATLIFRDGRCVFDESNSEGARVRLWFASPAHFNSMVAGNGSPVPLTGFLKLPFLLNDFPAITERLEYFLKPTDESNRKPEYRALNTRLTMYTAAYALREIGMHDPEVTGVAQHIRNGTVCMQVKGGDPAVHITFDKGTITPGKGTVPDPMALIEFQSVDVAGDFLNGRTDAFTEIAAGRVKIAGQTGMLDAMTLILDRIPLYLE